MRKIVFLATTICMLYTAVSHASIGPMNYQGRLLDDNGVPVTGNYTFVVSVWDASNGGVLQFQEKHGVSVNDGVYSFLVSTGTVIYGTWDINLWNQPELYLELEVAGETLSPRTRIAAAPYAFQANLALTTNNALALGGKSADDYDTILEDICASGNGKWLDVEEQCMGVGSVVTGVWTALDSGADQNDYKNLDLTNADISGASFSGATGYWNGANFEGSTFKNTTVSAAGLDKVVLDDVYMDGVITTEVNPVTVNSKFQGAVLKNMDLSNWNLSGANLTGLSASYLTGCPEDLPADWQCKEMHFGGGLYFLVGPYANLSSTSGLAIEGKDGIYLDLDNNALKNVDLSSAKFMGVTITQDIQTDDMAGANFDNATFKGARVTVTNGSYMLGINFDNTTWLRSSLLLPTANESHLMGFQNMHFNYSHLQLPIINPGSPQYVFNGFDGSIFENTRITGGGGTQLPFFDVVFNNAVLDVNASTLLIESSEITGKFTVDNYHSGSYVDGLSIRQAELTGRYYNWDFVAVEVYHSRLDGYFYLSDWSESDFQWTDMGYYWYNAVLGGQGNTSSSLTWYGTCPAGGAPTSQGPDGGGSCAVSW